MPDIRSVVQRHRGWLLQVDGVEGVGVGREDHEDVLKILVKERTAEQARKIPPEIDGYRVVIVETGPIRARTGNADSDPAA